MKTGGLTDIVIDANSLIDLIKLELLGQVVEIKEYRFIVVDEVLLEVRRPEQNGILRSVIEKGKISKKSLSTNEELSLFTRLRSILGLGESAGLAYASLHGCLFLSDETQRAFIREAAALIGEMRIVRTPNVIVRAIECNLASMPGLKKSLDVLKRLAVTPRDRDDIDHLRRVIERVAILI